MTSILILGSTTKPRLTQILNAAVTRLGLTEVRVVAETEMDRLAVEWNARRYELRRYWVEPEGDVALVFPGWDGGYKAGRVIYVDA